MPLRALSPLAAEIRAPGGGGGWRARRDLAKPFEVIQRETKSPSEFYERRSRLADFIHQ